MTDLAELRTFADYHRELADKADALILAMEADPKGTPTAVEEPRFYWVEATAAYPAGVRDRVVPDALAKYLLPADADALNENRLSRTDALWWNCPE